MRTKSVLPALTMSLLAAALVSGCSEQPKQEAAKEESSVTAAVDKAMEQTADAVESAKQETAAAADEAQQAASSALDEAKAKAADAVDAAKAGADDAMEGAKAAANDAVDGAKAMAGDAMDSAKAGAADMMAKADGAMAEQKLDGKSLATTKGCVACHSTTDAKMIGPGWGGLAGTERSFTDGTSAVADDAYLRAAITNPNAQIVEGFAPAMPAMPLSEAELDALVAYINTLK
ncbi:cytochrome c [uncultured Ferrimonas sp.]|uniref:c-type cytochrome n=1 Tax=uncultured Ferrimonas sp. TaxID=432640 RepID=UPI002624B2CC|nr:cytochrome c [uncultured Ferrimonas sp.]